MNMDEAEHEYIASERAQATARRWAVVLLVVGWAMALDVRGCGRLLNARQCFLDAFECLCVNLGK